MLITKEIISQHREISKAVRDDKINPHISDAEELDLAPLLGEDLFNSIVNDRATDPTAHDELMKGGEYEVDGKKYRHPGLEKVLAVYAYARYILKGSFTDTAFGFVQKSTQDAQPVEGSSKKTIYTNEQQTAALYFSQVATFLTRKNYPLWNTGCSARPNTGFRISKITR